jgi:hypothetical protein
MPLVKRKINANNTTTTMSKHVVDHIFYVPPGKVRPDDEIVAPSSPRQLAELAELYPDEYGEQAAAAEKEGDVGTAQPTATGRARKIAKMNAKDAIAAIGELDEQNDDDVAVLWAVYETETLRGAGENDPPEVQPRATVLAALERKGVHEGDPPPPPPVE